MGWMGVGDHGRSTPFRPQQTEYCSYDGVDTVGLASISADVNSLNVGERGWGVVEERLRDTPSSRTLVRQEFLRFRTPNLHHDSTCSVTRA